MFLGCKQAVPVTRTGLVGQGTRKRGGVVISRFWTAVAIALVAAGALFGAVDRGSPGALCAYHQQTTADGTFATSTFRVVQDNCQVSLVSIQKFSDWVNNAISNRHRLRSPWRRLGQVRSFRLVERYLAVRAQPQRDGPCSARRAEVVPADRIRPPGDTTSIVRLSGSRRLGWRRCRWRRWGRRRQRCRWQGWRRPGWWRRRGARICPTSRPPLGDHKAQRAFGLRQVFTAVGDGYEQG